MLCTQRILHVRGPPGMTRHFRHARRSYNDLATFLGGAMCVRIDYCVVFMAAVLSILNEF